MDPDVAMVVAQVDAAAPFVSVTTTGSASTVWLSHVAEHVASGDDPLAPWRSALRAQQERVGGAPVPEYVPSAFVLQWWCEVAATPIAYAAGLGPWVLEPDPMGLGFELAPALHPERIVVVPEHSSLEVEHDEQRRSQRSRAAYERLVTDLVRGFAPEVKMSSRQRWGVVDDMWVAAARRAAGAAGVVVGPEPMRTSCCFIFVLPGMRECASCPRHGSMSGQ